MTRDGSNAIFRHPPTKMAFKPSLVPPPSLLFFHHVIYSIYVIT